MLELRAGVKTFIARQKSAELLDGRRAVGGRPQVTGVFSALDGNWLAGQDVNSFELLVNSPANVQVIACPARWTLRRLLAVREALKNAIQHGQPSLVRLFFPWPRTAWKSSFKTMGVVLTLAWPKATAWAIFSSA